jgi:hypothetical protein
MSLEKLSPPPQIRRVFSALNYESPALKKLGFFIFVALNTGNVATLGEFTIGV